MATNILSIGSSFLFIFLISIDKIRFLRFFEIKYPENVQVIFTIEVPIPDNLPNAQIEENYNDGSFPKIFQSYGVSRMYLRLFTESGVKTS